MDKKDAQGDQTSASQRGPYQVRLPGFVTNEAIGLGDVIKRVTSTVGIRPCGGCEGRAAALNRWLVFSGGRSRGF